MSLLIRTLWLALLLSLPCGASAKPSNPGTELETVYKEICDLENNIPNVEEKGISFEDKFISVNAYWERNKDAQYELCTKFWRLIPDRNSPNPGIIKEKQRVISQLHQQDGASFVSIGALSANLRGSEANDAMKAYVRNHPATKLTRYAAWMLRSRTKRPSH